MKLHRRLLALSILALLALLLWRLRSGDPTPVAAPLAVGAAVAASAALPAWSASSPLSTADLVRGVQRPAAPAAAAGPGVWDLCGIGRLPRPVGSVDAAGDPWMALPTHLGAEPVARALDGLVRTLDAGGPRQRAAAMMLRGSDAAGAEAPQALSALATAERDPVIANWRLRRCGARNNCSEADALRWAELEPDNLAAWLEVAQHLPARRAEVLQRAPGTARFDLHQGKLLETVLAAMPADALPYVQVSVWIYVIGVEAAFSMPPAFLLTSHCKPPPEPGSERQQACSAMARVMREHSDTALGRLLGLRLAELSGEPRDVLNAERQQINQGQQLPAGLFDDKQVFSCASHARMGAWLALRARLGEWGALQALAADAAASSAATATR